MDTLAKRIKNLREEKGLSQKELANYLNISNSTLSQYESGVRVPSDDIKIKIARYFNVTTDYLLGNSNVKQLSRKDEIDIQKDLEEMKKDMTKGTLRLSLDGEIVDDEIKQFILDNMENTLILAKIKAKEKFNPNKNKK
ncbi:Helix-turn-helix [Peptoniphilus asaccharolyticus DSM 20463]|uniref:Helix-turn-helix n=1 Tax=Peptoniphilus asaccharolyticus DSM 20463 TaxID=573058 RepID=A0A1W1V2L0_PEPAS|nr:helix-turn-helix transcriptional regulator [Peptoniphilus asaccharolyticus]MBL7575559.1 helix-turn-helix transcriptional regulator [Peptoniphilus asaccharolyticus]SMB87261.1 Helix-turn-helix [Peptoniphilus asaccharolyticus DSM 20463]